MIRLILLVFVIMMIYSFMKSKRELDRVQAEKAALNSKKDNANDKLGIDEKVSVQDKYGRVFILSEDKKLYVFDSEKDTIEEIKGMKSISTKRRYATVKSGWASCTQLQDVVLKIELEDGEYLTEINPNEANEVEKFEEKVVEYLGVR